MNGQDKTDLEKHSWLFVTHYNMWMSTTAIQDKYFSINKEILVTLKYVYCLKNKYWGHGGRVVTLSPPTSEAGVRFTALPQVGKLVVAGRW